MLREERHQLILDILSKEGKIIATELSARLRVSEDTIRRDLRELDAQGLVHRVHGGALQPGPPVVSFDDRHEQSPEAKAQIAKTALQLVKNGQVIIIDGGTTTLKFAEQLPTNLSATVITNSPPVAAALAAHPAIEVIVLGGRLLKRSIVNIGGETLAALDQIRADLCVLGAYSVDSAFGLSAPDQEEAFVKRKMISVSTETAVLAAGHKLGTASSYLFAKASQIAYLVTDSSVNPEILRQYESSGITVLQR
ncbi:DeoR/GlpR family DNA-binding transcription regulator [Paenibacillaceae bacterium WGS1546]|uniref:DeoR/GlpR family DNA-binding transcription regulator n=1 Tax=Cohnella sp. WGS1546 TaxID=3366810 RepID=UPI00372D31FD